MYGYYKCSADQRQRVSELMNQGMQMGVGAMVRNGLFGRIGSTFNGGGVATHQPVPNTMPGTFA